MEKWLILLVPIIFGTVITIFGIGLRKNFVHVRRAEDRARQAGAAFYVQTGGARIGSVNSSIPFATVVVTSDLLTLTSFGKCYEFPKSSVRNVERYRALFSSGILIHHDQPNINAFVVFWSVDAESLLRAFERFGWSADRK